MVSEDRVAAVTWWPVDKLIAGYFVLETAVLLVYARRIPEALMLAAWHVAALVVLAAAIRYPSRASFVFRHWYPLPYVASCYKVMALLIPAIRGSNADAELAAADYAIWGVHPTVWLERIQSAALTEAVQWLYSLFVPAVLLVAFILWHQRRFEDFRRYAFLIALGFLVSYIGYLAVPARGPRFLLAHLQHTELRGLWLYEALRVTLDRLESAHYDCFPSGHTELTMLAWWGTRNISRRLSLIYLPYTLSIIFATVYLRYHYTVDVMAGAAVAVGLMVAAPYLYRILEGAGRWETSKSFGFRTGQRGNNS